MLRVTEHSLNRCKHNTTTGIINSRSSVHRPPSSARANTNGATSQALQHDLDLLNVVRESTSASQKSPSNADKRLVVMVTNDRDGLGTGHGHSRAEDNVYTRDGPVDPW